MLVIACMPRVNLMLCYSILHIAALALAVSVSQVHTPRFELVVSRPCIGRDVATCRPDGESGR